MSLDNVSFSLPMHTIYIFCKSVLLKRKEEIKIKDFSPFFQGSKKLHINQGLFVFEIYLLLYIHLFSHLSKYIWS